MKDLSVGARVEVHWSRRRFVRGTIVHVDSRSDELPGYYRVRYDEPISHDEPGRYSMLNGRATPVKRIELDGVFPDHAVRALNVLELMAEAACDGEVQVGRSYPLLDLHVRD